MPPVPRKKSCLHCRTAKARCDLSVPSCSRCTDRQLRCHYDAKVANASPYPRRTPVYVGSDTALPSPPELAPASSVDDITLPQHDDLDWLNADYGFDVDKILGLPSGTINTMSTTDADASSTTSLESRNTMADYSLVLPGGHASTETDLTVSIVLGQIKRYPRMILEDSRLPPFIHSRCATGRREDIEPASELRRHLLEPLAICADIVRLFYSKTQASNAFFWRTLRAEQRRLLDDYSKYDNLTLLASLQALVLYFLLQAQETDSFYHSQSFEIATQAVVEICDKLRRVEYGGFDSGSDRSGQAPSWERWAFHESLRRSVNVLYVVHQSMSYILGPESTPCEGYNDVPLPCVQDLWAAPRRLDWEVEYARWQKDNKEADTLTIGTIRHSLPTGADPVILKTLQRWCSGLDEFGSLVWTISRTANREIQQRAGGCGGANAGFPSTTFAI